MTVALPSGFRCYVTNLGIKDDSDDFAVVASVRPCASAGLYTKLSLIHI